MHKLFCLIIALTPALSVHAETATSGRNLILIIGDGFDDQHVTMGRNYLVGMSGKLTLDAMPYRASVQVETVSEQGQPLYVADSANTATSLATGGITQIGRIMMETSFKAKFSALFCCSLPLVLTSIKVRSLMR